MARECQTFGRRSGAQYLILVPPRLLSRSNSGAAIELSDPLRTMDYLYNELHAQMVKSDKVRGHWISNPKDPLTVYVLKKSPIEMPSFRVQQGRSKGKPDVPVFRATIVVDKDQGVVGCGDGETTRAAQRAAAFDAVMQLAGLDLLDLKIGAGSDVRKPARTMNDIGAESGKLVTAASDPRFRTSSNGEELITLTNGKKLTIQRARDFMDFYCKEFRFGRPFVDIVEPGKTKKGDSIWMATMKVGGAMVGAGAASNKKSALSRCYLDTVAHIESCDPGLYARFDKTHSPNAPVTSAPHVSLQISDDLNSEIKAVTDQASQTLLFSKRPKPAGWALPGEAANDGSSVVPHHAADYRQFHMPSQDTVNAKSQELLDRLHNYSAAPRMAGMRASRQLLPVTKHISDIIVQVELHDVVILMASTGSGKSTQVPQLLLDDATLQNKGGAANIVCAQPRRIAAVSLAQRVAAERDEQIGQSVGYSVRFDSVFPENNGSILYCTTGVLMKRLQNALHAPPEEASWLDTLSHIVIDEVHERDIQIDLLLVVLKKIMERRDSQSKAPIKIILMSATVDPTLFSSYFVDKDNKPAPVISIPGRAFPVEKHFMEDTIPQLQARTTGDSRSAWVWQEKAVRDYIHRELTLKGGFETTENRDEAIDDLEFPYPLVSLFIADVMSRSQEGHVLVFLPGWDEIKIIQNHLMDGMRYPLLGLNFNDISKYEIHILHSSIPVAEQQAVFSRPKKGVRRIILSTNIAETSVTIPDVTVVIDSGRVKEMRHEPSKHLSKLVSAWVGTSNLNQRAGRAGRHRSGDYYGVLSKARYDRLPPNQTVEMQRADLTDVVLHIKALDLPGMDPEDVFAAAIEPPDEQRVAAAMHQLITIGALDDKKNLTSLGSVLLQLPIDAGLGKMVLYGLFFRCVEPAILLAAILSTRDPFMAPIEVKQQAAAIKEAWSPSDYRSDVLATLRAYQTWHGLQKKGDVRGAMRFAHDNFLSKPSLVEIEQLSHHIERSVVRIIRLLFGDEAFAGDVDYHRPKIPADFNANAACTPLLAAMIAMASNPRFAVRKSERVYQTLHDKMCIIHTSSVCHLKHSKGKEDEVQPGEKELYTYAEKTMNTSHLSPNAPVQTMLKSVTRLDPVVYLLFGTNSIRQASQGVMCDQWLPIKGDFQALDDIERLKSVMDASLLRIFEGIVEAGRPPEVEIQAVGSSSGGVGPVSGTDGTWDECEISGEVAERGAGVDSSVVPDAAVDRRMLEWKEVEEFEILTKGIVGILERHCAERLSSLIASRSSTRPTSPVFSVSPPARAVSPVTGLKGSSSGMFTSSVPKSSAGWTAEKQSIHTAASRVAQNATSTTSTSGTANASTASHSHAAALGSTELSAWD